MSRSPASELRLTPEAWDQHITAVTGPQIVVGGPGTGKTEFLVRRATHLMREGHDDALLLLSFSRRSVADLRDRVARALDTSFSTVPASTFHSLAHRMLEASHIASASLDPLPQLLTGPEQVALVAELLGTEEPDRWPLTLRGLLASPSFAKEVTDFLLRCYERLIDPDTLDDLAAQRADWRAIPGFFRRYEEALSEQNRVDYGSLMARAVNLLTTGPGAALAAPYRFVLVDEYQDTTAAQRRLLQLLYREHRNLTVAADPYQSIYSFRGAELENVSRFPTDFPDAEGALAQRIVLTTSFRTPPAVLQAAERITASGELPGAAGPVTPAAGEGSVVTYLFEQQTEEAEWVAAEVQRLHLESAIPYSRMAVFVRSKRRLIPELSRALERRDIPHDVPDSRLADQPAVRMVLDCVIAATEPEPEADRALRRILLGPMFRRTISAVRNLEHTRASSSATWPEVLAAGLPDGGALADLLSDSSWATTMPAAQGFWHVWSSLPQFAALVADAGRADERSAWASLSQVLGQLNERNSKATLLDYLRLTEQEDFEASPLLSYRQPEGDRLVVTTLHQSKGLEFEIVFMADAVRGIFPDLRARESLLGARFLSPALAGDTSSYLTFRLQEEMRLAYTAMTRARRQVVWTATIASVGEGPEGPSRFLAMVDPDGGGRAPEHQLPVSPLDAEAWLRRMLRNPGEPHARRLAAAAALGDADRWQLRPIETFAGVTDPGPDTGLITADHRLSPSQADRYEACPRRYALERRLHVGDEETVYAAFGTLIHDVLEIAERRAVDAGNGHSTVDAARRALDELWDPLPFGGEPWSTAWRRRAETALDQLYELWPGAGPAVAIEADVALERGGTLWRGRIDRLEKRSDHTAVIDYKTSKTPMGVPEAASSLQLGFYLLAAAGDPDLAAHGPPAAAELWYPLRPQKNSIAVRRFDPEQLPDVEARLDAAAHGIATEDWHPRPSDDCRRCRVRLVCPAWPEGREAFSG